MPAISLDHHLAGKDDAFADEFDYVLGLILDGLENRSYAAEPLRDPLGGDRLLRGSGDDGQAEGREAIRYTPPDRYVAVAIAARTFAAGSCTTTVSLSRPTSRTPPTRAEAATRASCVARRVPWTT